MLKKLVAFALLIGAVYWSFYVLLPNTISDLNANDNTFSTQRALVQLKEISKSPHYLGNQAHTKVRNYIISELEKLGLQPEVQEGYSISQWGNLSKPKNIVARIPGTNPTKALLLMSHYDSNPHSSFGASDAGSGVVTILEGLRAYLKSNTPKNDIIVLITDGEELGLNGADIFVKQHSWAKDVGLVLNFEARGSGGPSYMLIETNQGNANLMKGFVAANPEFPVANSLAYSIYKMLPNDTDLTRFREDADIDGFNFAFIDDHFDYHTALDTYQRTDRNSLEHQGSYLMPLLSYFAKTDLTQVKSNEDYIYFNVPLFKTVIYPFAWNIPMLIIGFVIFILLLIYGFKRRVLNSSSIGKGFLSFLISLGLTGGLGFILWKTILAIFPQYQEMLHGFTYNGHTYIVAFVGLSLTICFYIYHKFYAEKNTANLLVAPITIWLVICAFIVFKLEGASFFIIPVYFALISLFVIIRQQKPNLILLALLAFPVITIMAPFVKMFPVGLGLKILFVSCIFVSLIFGFLIPVFGFFKHKNRWALLFSVIGLWFLGSAFLNSDFTNETPKPNSLVYILDDNNNTASWATYDTMLDEWNKSKLGNSPKEALPLKDYTAASKYSTGFTYMNSAKVKKLPKPIVDISWDTIINGKRTVELCFKSQRQAERIEVYADTTLVFNNAIINGVEAHKNTPSNTVFGNRKSKRLFSYYIADDEPLDIVLTIPANQKTSLEFFEATFNLLQNKRFNIPKRLDNMIPKPFVLNDAVIVKKTVTLD
ncbi:M28 family peptidase [Mangrovimonas spongiae]|uniref:Vacuolar membrane protease n=1 Tax=Mangrovimonas spongiae TaxID=2494697 RepID=A0A3R9MIR0_9FLAO|nr:M28 family peptidase [Mangrovimonas spongiae]RSK41357.1 M28 family peptidase [Mangrovimonas spongiae]